MLLFLSLPVELHIIVSESRFVKAWAIRWGNLHLVLFSEWDIRLLISLLFSGVSVWGYYWGYHIYWMLYVYVTLWVAVNLAEMGLAPYIARKCALKPANLKFAGFFVCV